MDNLSSLACRGWGIPLTGSTSKPTQLGMALLQSPDADTSKTMARLSHLPLSSFSYTNKYISSLLTPWVGLHLPPADIQYPQPPWGTIQLLHSHSWSSPDAIFLQTNWKMMVILHRMNRSEVFSAFCLTGTFWGLCITRNSAFTHWDYLRSSIILVTQQSILLQIYMIHFK